MFWNVGCVIPFLPLFRTSKLTFAIYMLELKHRFIYIFLFVYAVVAAITLVMFDGTGDAGDSVMHFLFSKYAPSHPELYFHHWAKPFFVLLSSPFAQFGFIGIKIFNALVTGVTLYYTYKCAEKLNMVGPWWASVILLCMPLYYILTFSGLTEPLFAMMLAMAVYYILADHNTVATLTVSMLPFVRSEGLILLGVFAVYYMVTKKWKQIPLLLFGHVIYSVAGYFVYDDILWVFTKIPYANIQGNYGSGELFHYIYALIPTVGVPIYALLCVGTVWLIIQMFQKFDAAKHILILGGFAAFFVAHTLFWYLGLFNSFGLKRVFIAVTPFMSIIALYGLQAISKIFGKIYVPFRKMSFGIALLYIVAFSFIPNPNSVMWDQDMNLSSDQKVCNDWVKTVPISKGTKICSAYSYLAVVSPVDWFDKEQRVDMTREEIQKLKTGDMIVWENWFAEKEWGIAKEELDHNTQLKNIYYRRDDENGRNGVFAVYIKK